jgi:hypothetical protein
VRLPESPEKPTSFSGGSRSLGHLDCNAQLVKPALTVSGPGSKSCPTPPYNRFIAIAYLGQTVVFVDAPGFTAGTRSGASPYNTRKGIEMVVRALQPRVPTHVASGSNR